MNERGKADEHVIWTSGQDHGIFLSGKDFRE
jgi:hypothetical protein